MNSLILYRASGDCCCNMSWSSPSVLCTEGTQHISLWNHMVILVEIKQQMFAYPSGHQYQTYFEHFLCPVYTKQTCHLIHAAPYGPICKRRILFSFFLSKHLQHSPEKETTKQRLINCNHDASLNIMSAVAPVVARHEYTPQTHTHTHTHTLAYIKPVWFTALYTLCWHWKSHLASQHLMNRASVKL